LVVVGRPSDVTRFRRIVAVRASCVFREDMLAGEGQALFCEEAKRIGRNLREKRYVFQTSDDDGQEYFRDLSRLWPLLRFVYVYGYGSYLIFRGRIYSYRVPLRRVEKVMIKHGVDDNPNDEWPYEPEIDAETELVDLAEAHWQKSPVRHRILCKQLFK
jgi:hypothetical protein